MGNRPGVNSKDITLAYLEFLLAEHFHIYQLFLEPSNVGHTEMSRSRTYIIFARRGATKILSCPFELLQNISESIARHIPRVYPRDVLVASEQDVAMDAMHVANVRRIEHQYQPAEQDLRYLMNERELTVIEQLNNKWIAAEGTDPEEEPDLCYFTGDNPSNRATWSGGPSRRIPTFRMNQGKFYFPHKRRWLVAKEKLCALGFPILTNFAQVAGLPVLHVSDYRRAGDIAGNAMSLPCCQLAVLIALSCFGPCD